MFDIDITGEKLDLAVLRRAAREPLRVRVTDAVRAKVAKAAEAVASIVDSGRVTYGINTGFGLLAQRTIPRGELEHLQRNLVLSHAAGVGAPLPDAVVRLVMLLKIVGLTRGHSGTRVEIVDALVALLRHEVYPVVPEKGSVGASGDLAPLAHLSAVLMGEGQARHHGQLLSGREAMKAAGLEPIVFHPKEALALLNGTQVSTALALDSLFALENIFGAALVAGALSVDAAMGSDVPFDSRIQEARGQPGQIEVAKIYRQLLQGSEIRAAHAHCDRVQDPYCLRCQPQVMGACLDLMRQSARTLTIEASAVTDNPLIFPETGEALSGGNFHAEPVAMAADALALAIAEVGAMAERRIAMLIDPGMSRLPAFLVENGGVNSGFMIAQVTAAALASENKSLAHPACVDSMPTSANQEDHVSMATFAARRLREMAFNTANIVTIELLAAAQGVEFRAPLKTSPALARAMATIRMAVPRYDRDRAFSPDIEAMCKVVQDGGFRELVGSVLP